MKNKLVIQSELRSLNTVYQWLEKYLLKKVSEEKLRNILWVTHEMVTNSILHGNKNIIEKAVTVEITVNESNIEIEIQDEGEGLISLPSKEEAKELDYLSENGRGVKLAVFMTERIELNGNRMKLIFNKA